jgi:hypothetical protein
VTCRAHGYLTVQSCCHRSTSAYRKAAPAAQPCQAKGLIIHVAKTEYSIEKWVPRLT